MDYNELKDKYNDIVTVKECNKFGNLCFYMQKLNLKSIKNKHDELVHYIYLCCLECLKLSKNNNNKTYTVHVYLENVTVKHFSFSLFKKLNYKLENNLEDVLNACYIYNASNSTKRFFKILSPLINKDTLNKIIFFS
tara:strand:- start:421 stop:831 length:411 start_codon:yes stop_codon:yes gene_type:complete